MSHHSFGQERLQRKISAIIARISAKNPIDLYLLHTLLPPVSRVAFYSPLNRPRRFAGDVEDAAVHTFHFVDDAASRAFPANHTAT